MKVSLEIIYQDQSFFEVYAEIAITNPAQPSRGSVWVADDSTIRWQCELDSTDQAAHGISAAGIAAAITATLTGTGTA